MQRGRKSVCRGRRLISGVVRGLNWVGVDGGGSVMGLGLEVGLGLELPVGGSFFL